MIVPIEFVHLAWFLINRGEGRDTTIYILGTVPYDTNSNEVVIPKALHKVKDYKLGRVQVTTVLELAKVMLHHGIL